MVETYNDELINDLLSIEAIQVKEQGYFTLTSGLKSPIYCDNRLTISYPNIRKKIIQSFEQKLKDLNIQPDLIVGCATAGIPHATLLSDALDLPLSYVRSSKKSHGKENMIEGKIKKGSKAIVIEDLISTGNSALKVVEALRENDVEVLAVLAIFTYGFKQSIDNFKDHSVSLYTLTHFDNLIRNLKAEKNISQEQINKLIHWRDAL